MDYLIAQKTRYQLQTKVRRIKNASDSQYYNQLKFFIEFIHGNSIFSHAINELIEGSQLNRTEYIESASNGNVYNFKDEIQYIAGAYLGLKHLSENGISDPRLAMAMAASLNDGDRVHKPDDIMEIINRCWVTFLFEHLDEAVDNRNSILYLLKKYKQRAEWFRRSFLTDIAENGVLYGKKGERGLIFDLYETLHQEGLDIKIEPSSASGEVDLIGDQPQEERIVLDAKYTNSQESSSSIKTKVCKGIRQVYDYCNDYNVGSGYLFLYNNSKYGLNLESEEIDDFKCINYNGKIIYFVIADIFAHETSASQRGSLQTIDIKRSDFLAMDASN